MSRFLIFPAWANIPWVPIKWLSATSKQLQRRYATPWPTMVDLSLSQASEQPAFLTPSPEHRRTGALPLNRATASCGP